MNGPHQPPDDGDVRSWLWCLDPDPAEAERLYRQLRRDLIRHLSWRGDPEGIADEAIARGLRQLSKRGPTSLSAARGYIYRTAHFVGLEDLKKNRDVRNVDPIAELPSAASDQAAVDQRLRIEAALKTLDPRERELFVRYHTEGDHEALCREWNVTPGNLRVMIYRIKQKLNLGEEGTKRG